MRYMNMKKLAKVLIAAAGATLLFALPAQAATYYATDVYADPGVRADGNDNQNERDNPSNALGAPDDNFWSLGQGGISVFAFSPPGTFNDKVMTIERTFNCNSVNSAGNCSHYAEDAELYLYSGPAIDFDADYGNGTFGPNGENAYDFTNLLSMAGIVFADTIGNGEANTEYEFDLSGLTGDFLYVILKDISPLSSPDGFDVVSVSVSAVPLPPAVLLFGAALGGLGFLSRRRKKAQAAA